MNFSDSSAGLIKDVPAFEPCLNITSLEFVLGLQLLALVGWVVGRMLRLVELFDADRDSLGQPKIR